MKRGWLVVAGSAFVLLGFYVFRTYPRPVALTLHGVQYRLGNPGQPVMPIVVTLHGSLDRSLLGPETFSGTVDITGSTWPDRANGKFQTISFDPEGLIVYYSRSNQFHTYGAIYPNRSFTAVAVQEWHHSSWNSGNGLVIVAPAKTRVQALDLSNDLMKPFLAGRRLT